MCTQLRTLRTGRYSDLPNKRTANVPQGRPECRGGTMLIKSRTFINLICFICRNLHKNRRKIRPRFHFRQMAPPKNDDKKK